MTESYWLDNVRLESGYEMEDARIAATKTELCRLRIEDGKIADISPASSPLAADARVADGKGMLALPPFRDMHIHLDKTYYGGPWKAVRPAPHGIFSRLREEEELLPRQLPVARERAEKLLGLLVSHGVTHVRAHCNIDPIVGLANLEATVRALETFRGTLSAEIVAFPQHGLLRSNAVPLVKEALRHGATLVGGVDPATVDGNIEASLQAMMELATEAGAGVDLHLHDPDHLGVFTMRRLARLTEQAGWQGKVTISHAFGLAGVSAEAAADAADLLAALRMDVASAVPIGARTMPIPMLHRKGVRVHLGQDSITDHWSPFGTGDMLEKAGRLAECCGWSDERGLEKALGFITGGVLPLDDSGSRAWPAVGSEASMVLTDASCAAEAVARRAKRRDVYFKGKLVSSASNR
ncbi:amidohydrolase family protein [Paenibacillus sp. GYB003]|uniref:amidohydrolase family protein n=1 Tax=Paenibacillus sp. GYB003 TaxID=2994392 RepID=UPI002F9653AC